MLKKIFKSLITFVGVLFLIWISFITSRRSIFGKIASIIIGLVIIMLAFNLIGSSLTRTAELIGIGGKKTVPEKYSSAPTPPEVPTTLKGDKTKPSGEEISEELKVLKSIVKIGDAAYGSVVTDGYRGGVIKKVDKIIKDYNDGSVIRMPSRLAAEVEVTFSNMKLRRQDFFTDDYSYFEIIPDPRTGVPRESVRWGKIRSYYIGDGKAIALIFPWVNVYGENGNMQLVLYLETESGIKLKKVWNFEVYSR